GEGLELEPVRDEPWWAFNYFLGGLRSRVVINLDNPTASDDLVELAAHEVYPGHHTEHALKEKLLGETIQMVPTPAALVSEGIAETGPAVVLDDGLIDRLEAVLERHGLPADLRHARAVRAARRPLRRIGVDTALMLHEDGASVDEVVEHSMRWSL